MSDPPSGDLLDSSLAPLPPVARAPRLSPWVTAGCSVVVGVLIGVFVLGRPSTPLEGLDRPDDSLARLVSRQLDLREALVRTVALEQALGVLLGALDATLDEPVAWYEELAEADEVAGPPSPDTDLHRAILLGEAGRGAEARAQAAAWRRGEGDRPRRAAWVLAAYGDAPADRALAEQALVEIREDLPPSWFSDTLAVRIAARIGDDARRAEAEAAILARGRALLWRWRGLVLGQLALVLGGAAALRVLLSRRGRAPLGAALLPPPWPPWDGFGLFVRSAFGFLVIGGLPPLLASGRSAVAAIGGLAAGVPAVAWIAGYLTAAGRPPLAVFGLRVRRADMGALAGVTLALIALGIVGEAVITLVAAGLDMRSHWADGFPEDVLWEPWWLVAVSTVDTALWAPFVEELTFRGVVFGSLRVWLPAVPAALLSAVLFAGAHGYGATGFASVLWSGIVWALAYERTRSLWPSILAHTANNLLVNITIVGLLRL